MAPTRQRQVADRLRAEHEQALRNDLQQAINRAQRAEGVSERRREENARLLIEIEREKSEGKRLASMAEGAEQRAARAALVADQARALVRIQLHGASIIVESRDELGSSTVVGQAVGHMAAPSAKPR